MCMIDGTALFESEKKTYRCGVSQNIVQKTWFVLERTPIYDQEETLLSKLFA